MSLKRIQAMSIADRERYAARFMAKYADPLREAGFEKGSLEYEVVEIVLSAIQHGIFDRCY